MNNNMFIELNGKIVYFTENKDAYQQPKSFFLEKCWFIAQRVTFLSLDMLVPMAELWIQKKKLGVTYSVAIENQLKYVVEQQ